MPTTADSAVAIKPPAKPVNQALTRTAAKNVKKTLGTIVGPSSHFTRSAAAHAPMIMALRAATEETLVSMEMNVSDYEFPCGVVSTTTDYLTVEIDLMTGHWFL